MEWRKAIWSKANQFRSDWERRKRYAERQVPEFGPDLSSDIVLRSISAARQFHRGSFSIGFEFGGA